MIGGSYGGQIQYAVAEQDPRLDTIIPIITWNDLSYSLAPNNTSLRIQRRHLPHARHREEGVDVALLRRVGSRTARRTPAATTDP